MPAADNGNNSVSDKALSTIVRNTSGATKFFAYLGTKGKELAANEQYIHRGNLAHRVATVKGGRYYQFYENDLNNGYLTIEATPATILYDYTTSQPRQLVLANGVLGFMDPLTEPAPSSSFVDGSP